MTTRPRQCKEGVDYFPDTFGEMYAIDEDSKFGEHEGEALMQRLSLLTKMAHRLGFMSLQDAAFADAKQYKTDKDSRERLLAFAAAGCHEKLISIFCDCIDTRSKFQVPEKMESIYLQEFEGLRRLEILNNNLREWDSDYFTAFSFPAIHEDMATCAPNLVRLLDGLAGLDAIPRNEQNDILVQQQRQRQRHVVMLCAQLANVRNPATNYIQGMFALYFFASKVPRRVLTVINHVGMSVSYNTLRNFLQSAADDARSRLVQPGTSENAFLVVFDNLTKHSKVHDHRILHDNYFLNFTAGFILVPPLSRQHRRHTRADFLEDEINNLSLCDFVPDPVDECTNGKAVLSILGSFFNRCIEKSNVKKKRNLLVSFPMPSIHQIDATDIPEILPLADIRPQRRSCQRCDRYPICHSRRRRVFIGTQNRTAVDVSWGFHDSAQHPVPSLTRS